MSASNDAAEPLSLEHLVEYFRAGETPPEDYRIGTEHEKVGVYVDDHRRVPYEGERGIGALLQKIAEVDGWDPVLEQGKPIALLKDGASITLEPGGQLELVRNRPRRAAPMNHHAPKRRAHVLGHLERDFSNDSRFKSSLHTRPTPLLPPTRRI